MRIPQMGIRFGLLMLIGSTILIGGCGLGGRQYVNINEDMLEAPHPTTARIYAKRNRAFSHGGTGLGKFHVVDSWDGIDKPYLLVESRRITCVDTCICVTLIEGDEGLVFESESNPGTFNIFSKKLNHIANYKKLYGEDWRVQALNRRKLYPNDFGIAAHRTAYIGNVTSGGMLVWERSPGKMQIEIINPFCNRRNSRSASVEAGKDYYVNFAKAGYGITAVTISETPFEWTGRIAD